MLHTFSTYIHTYSRSVAPEAVTKQTASLATCRQGCIIQLVAYVSAPRYLLSIFASPNRIEGIVTAEMASPMRQARRCSHTTGQQSGSQGVNSNGRQENPMAVSRVGDLARHT